MELRITTAGRHGRRYRVTLYSATGTTLATWTEPSLSDAVASAQRECPGVRLYNETGELPGKED